MAHGLEENLLVCTGDEVEVEELQALAVQRDPLANVWVEHQLGQPTHEEVWVFGQPVFEVKEKRAPHPSAH